MRSRPHLRAPLRLVALAALALAPPALSGCTSDKPGSAEPKIRVYRTIDGLNLRAEVYAPDPDPGAPLPAVVLIPGGGFVEADFQSGWLPEWGTALRDRGFVAAAIDYRVVSEFPAAPAFPGPVEDVACAVRWLRAHAGEYGVDPGRIFVVGASAGGHMAAMVAVGAGAAAACEGEILPAEGLAGVVDLYGPVDYTTIAAQRGRGPIGGEEAYVGARCTRESPLCDAASWWSWSPAEAPPFFIAHGTADIIVPEPQSLDLASGLEDLGVPVVYRPVEGAEHGWVQSTDQEVEAVFEEVVAWMEKLSG